MKRFLPLLLLPALFLFTACPTPETTSTSETNAEGTNTGVNDGEEQDPNAMGNQEISVSPLTNVYEIDGAQLNMNNINDDEYIPTGETVFEFLIEGYDLGVPTPDADGKGLANSKDGQHIHVILNNKPYMAHYNPEVEVNLEEDRYILVAFLSRSYHESIKADGAAIIKQFFTGDTEKTPEDLDLPMLVYSRPKGTYSGENAEQILLDFYLFNTRLRENGHVVKATIDNQEFMLDSWESYVIKGLNPGEHEIRLQLLDENGNKVDTPEGYGDITRTITVE